MSIDATGSISGLVRAQWRVRRRVPSAAVAVPITEVTYLYDTPPFGPVNDDLGGHARGDRVQSMKALVEVGAGVFALRFAFYDQQVGVIVGADGVLVIDTRSSHRQLAERAGG